MILVDANIFMYAAGHAHPHKAPSRTWLDRVAAGKVEAVTDAEVLQEILHRYRAISRWQDGRRVYDLACQIVPDVLPIGEDITDEARRLMDLHAGLWARDAVHAAVVRLHRLKAICSYDSDLDVVTGLRRQQPA